MAWPRLQLGRASWLLLAAIAVCTGRAGPVPSAPTPTAAAREHATAASDEEAFELRRARAEFARDAAGWPHELADAEMPGVGQADLPAVARAMEAQTRRGVQR